MQGWIDYTSIALSSYKSATFLHLGSYVDLTYGSSKIFSAVFLRYITQSP